MGRLQPHSYIQPTWKSWTCQELPIGDQNLKPSLAVSLRRDCFFRAAAFGDDLSGVFLCAADPEEAMVTMSFCSTLRRRPSCSSLVPVLLSNPELSLRESSLKTHDIEITLKPSENRRLRLIILTPSTITPDFIDCTLSRLQHFASLTGGTDSAIIFLLSPSQTPTKTSKPAITVSAWPSPLHALTHLQLTLQTSNLQVPLLPLSTPSTLSEIIHAFTASLITAPPVPNPPNAALHLLPHCTVNAPMKQDTFTALSDQFACLRDVAGMEEGEAGVERLVEAGLDTESAGACVEFWGEEWVCE